MLPGRSLTKSQVMTIANDMVAVCGYGNPNRKGINKSPGLMYNYVGTTVLVKKTGRAISQPLTGGTSLNLAYIP